MGQELHWEWVGCPGQLLRLMALTEPERLEARLVLIALEVERRKETPWLVRFTLTTLLGAAEW